MFEESLGLSDVLKKLKRADEALAEFVAPLWPGVVQAAVWIEGKAQLFRIPAAPAQEGYYLLNTDEGVATVLREAEAEEARQFRGYLPKAAVYLLGQDLAYPASFAERLQGITDPRPIHFAPDEPLAKVQARSDGLNLFFDGQGEEAVSPLAGLFSGSSIFTPGELLGTPGTESAGGGAEAAQAQLDEQPALVTEYRLRAVLDAAGTELEGWEPADGGLHVRWRRHGAAHAIVLASPASTISSGICLAGTRGFEPSQLTRLLLDHALDGWQ